MYVFQSFGLNKASREIVRNWILNNWEKMQNAGGGMSKQILRRVLMLTLPTAGISHIEEVRQFLDVNRSDELGRTFDQVMEYLEINERYAEVNR